MNILYITCEFQQREMPFGEIRQSLPSVLYTQHMPCCLLLPAHHHLPEDCVPIYPLIIRNGLMAKPKVNPTCRQDANCLCHLQLLLVLQAPE